MMSFSRVTALGLCWAVGMLLPASWAQTALAFERPQCAASEAVYGMCLNPDMEAAAAVSESPAFKAAFLERIEAAKAHLSTIQPSEEKVVITDLDETLVNNVDYYRQYKTFTPETYAAWSEATGREALFKEVEALLLDAKAKGFSLMFITGRPADQAAATLAQVSNIPWDGVFLRTTGKPVRSLHYKSQVKRMLRDLGYSIVLVLGDQPTDFDAPILECEGEFLLPNVLYGIP